MHEEMGVVSADTAFDISDGTVVQAPISTQPRETPKGRQRASRLRLAEAMALPILLVLVFGVFAALRPNEFPTLSNIRGIALTQSVLAILALGEILPLTVGDFDLSIGGNLALGVVLATGLPALQGLPLWAAVVITLVACTVVGAINGWLVNIVRVNAFIATLAMGLMLDGVALWYTKNQVIFNHIPQSLLNFGQNKLVGIPYPVVLVGVLAIIVWYLLEHTPTGRYCHAVGSNREAARLSGVRVERFGMIAFIGSGFLVGCAAITEASVIGSGDPTVGDPFLLPTFAAAFLGATAIRVGTFNVLGTIVAVATISLGIAGLELVGVSSYVQPIFNGAVLIAAVIATRFLRANTR
jgi:ribose transport system permease protein